MNDEHRRHIADCRDELAKIKEWIDKNSLDTNVKFLVAYAVVKSSGTIEIVFKSIIHEYLSSGCKKETKTFIERNVIDLACNPSAGNIGNILQQIDVQRRDVFESMIKGSREKADLNSLVRLRNDIAHGRDINTSINTVERYYESGIVVVGIMDSLLYKEENTLETYY